MTNLDENVVYCEATNIALITKQIYEGKAHDKNLMHEETLSNLERKLANMQIFTSEEMHNIRSTKELEYNGTLRKVSFLTAFEDPNYKTKGFNLIGATVDIKVAEYNSDKTNPSVYASLILKDIKKDDAIKKSNMIFAMLESFYKEN
jgi:hypothetical protein